MSEGDAETPQPSPEEEAQAPPEEAAQAPPGAEGQPDEEELRRRIEEGLREVRVQDVLLESVVTLINLTARRIGKEDEQDLEQARIGIEAVRSLTGLLEPEPQTQVRNALSELQMLFARHAGGEGGAGEGEATPGTAEPPPGAAEAPREPPKGPRRGSGPGLWTPPGS